MSIRFKVIFPYLLLTLVVAVTGAYVVTRLVSSSLRERLSNQLLEAGRVASDTMARQEIQHLESARIVAYTRGLGDALQAKDEEHIALLAKPAAGGLNVESLILFNGQGQESLRLIKRSDGTIVDLTQPGQMSTLSIVNELLAANTMDSLPQRELSIDPVDGRYYYYTAITVPAADDQVAGVVVVGTSLNTMLPLLKSTALADLILYGDQGQAIASTLEMQGLESLFTRTISVPEDIYQAVVNTDERVRGENFEVAGRWYSLLLSPLKVGEDRLGIFAVVLPLDFVVSSNSINRNYYVLLYSAAMLGVVFIGYVVARLIVNPIAALVRTSRAIASGDLSKRTEIKSRDEIGFLASTFDEMTRNLQQRTLQLEQMDRTKMRFIQVSAHELRTPLTSVSGYAQLMKMQLAENENAVRLANSIIEGGARMREIIENMLDVSRIDTNVLGVMPASMELGPVIEKVQAAFREALIERQITLTAQNLANLPLLCADQDLLYKVFYHVIVNAIKYTPDGGRITVSGRTIDEAANGCEIEIKVQDTGIGIDKAFQELIFEKFYQTGEVLVHSSGKTKFKGGGPGLGLAIARGIVNAHHGRIWIESPGHDEETCPGTGVYIRLPVNGSTHEGYTSSQ